MVENKKLSKIKTLCENCGKLAKHKSSECPKLHDEDLEENEENVAKKKYVPVHLSGTCPFCEFKFSDLLGHIRHGHRLEKQLENVCPLCTESFKSVRELVSHRQLHPQFKFHTCSKCSLEFETVVELRNHRAKFCTKSKKKKKIEQDQKVEIPKAKEENNPLNTLMLMANLQNVDQVENEPIFEGRGTVSCHLCSKSFILKTLLKRHYIAAHSYQSKNELISNLNCQECSKEFKNNDEAIKHHLDFHAQISGQICPYCDCKYGAKKFDNLDAHVSKHHVLEMQSPIQTCSTCKTNFNNYEALKVHRQIHEGGNRPRILVDVTSGEELISVHPRVGAKAEISNRGGLKCQLCNAFKLRKDHLKLHYIRHHGYDPKAANIVQDNPEIVDEEASMQGHFAQIECPSCHSMFENNHFLIKHLLKNHCTYSGFICPYCPGHFPSRFIDLQSHVTNQHMDKLTGYNISNKCKVCLKNFAGYAELRDHVQLHGDGYKDPLKKKKIVATSGDKILNRTKVLVPVSTDADGQLRLSSENLQKAILMVTQGGQVENLPSGGFEIQ